MFKFKITLESVYVPFDLPGMDKGVVRFPFHNAQPHDVFKDVLT